jgi:CBS domain containing-hemolysin-like protein
MQQLMGIDSPEKILIHMNVISGTYWVLFTLFSLLFFTLCELLPKMIFRKYPDQLCLYLSHLFAAVNFTLSPLVNVLRGVSRLILFLTGGRELQDHLFGSREELRQVMAESSQSLTEDEREMIDRVLDLQNIPVRDLAVPFEDLPEVTSEMSVAEVVEEYSVEAYIRIPVWQGSGDRRRIVGVINLRRLIFMPESEWRRPVSHFLESALYQDEDIRLQKLLQLMQRSGQRAVIILNKRRQELGMVSLPDILKVIFGEMRV